jgi:hypothetical protein
MLEETAAPFDDLQSLPDGLHGDDHDRVGHAFRGF